MWYLGSSAVWVVPLLYSKSPRYDVAKGGPFFDYLQLNFLVLDKIPALVSAPYNTESPILLDIKEIDGFYDKVGRNTEYIIHPAEILADNFRLLLFLCGDGGNGKRRAASGAWWR